MIAILDHRPTARTRVRAEREWQAQLTEEDDSRYVPEYKIKFLLVELCLHGFPWPNLGPILHIVQFSHMSSILLWIVGA